jgi:hypothetical protein
MSGLRNLALDLFNTNKKMARAWFSLIFFLLLGLQNANSLEAEITNKYVEACLKNEYSRGFNYYGELSSAAGLELNSRYSFSGGISFGIAHDFTSLNTFAGAEFSPFALSRLQAVKPLNFSLAYIYNGLPGYDVHTHSIQPVVSYKTRQAGASIGPCFRFTSLLGGSVLYEAIFSFSIYFNFINNENLLIGISVSNFDNFNARNTAAYSLNLNSAVRLNDRLMLINKLEFMQSGADGLTANFYGIAWRGGVKFTW